MKYIVALGFLVVSASLYFSVRYGVAPRPVPLIKATEVANLTEAGVLAFRRMRQEIRSNNLLLAGSDTKVSDYQEFWQGFVLAANNDGARAKRLIATRDVTLFKESQLLEPEFVENIVDQASLLLPPGPRTLVYSAAQNISHLVKGSVSSFLESRKRKATLITLTNFLVTREQVKESGIDCSEELSGFEAQLKCLTQKVSQQHYRKKLDTNKNYIALYRFGRQDYVAFWYSQ